MDYLTFCVNTYYFSIFIFLMAAYNTFTYVQRYTTSSVPLLYFLCAVNLY